MIKCTGLIACIVASALLCSPAYSDTLTFDDVPSGTVLRDSFYMDEYRVAFDSLFQATDHTASSWGLPHSGSNVLTWVSSEFEYGAQINFGYFTGAYAELDDIQSVGAYFSTDVGVVVKITAHHFTPPDTGVIVTSVVIGAPGESWDNRYVEISSPNGPFNILVIEGVNSPAELLSFCADDMTIVPVPEPCSLVALGAGLLALIARRRRPW